MKNRGKLHALSCHNPQNHDPLMTSIRENRYVCTCLQAKEETKERGHTTLQTVNKRLLAQIKQQVLYALL